jgi:pimeloyl-ACP methyl ester carboxylesterase
VAYWIAMTDPDLLGGIIALDAPPSRNSGDPDDLAEAKEGQQALLSATPSEFAKKMRRRALLETQDAVRGIEIGDAAALSSQKVAAEAFYDMMSLDLRSAIPKIEVPVLCLLSTAQVPKEHQAEYESFFREQLAPIPDHELVAITGAKHYLMFDAPSEFFRRVDGFLEKVDGSAKAKMYSKH